MQTYDSYKNSGIDWLGEIPSHWELIKSKFINKIFNGDSLNDSQKKKYESSDVSELAYISSKDIDVNYSTINYDNGLRISDFQNFKVAPQKSSLICIEGGSAGRKIAFTKQPVCFVNKLACVNTNNDNNSKFIYYSLKGRVFQHQFKNALSGLIGGVAISVINNFIYTLPPITEQEAIAAFLDEKCGKIDELVSVKEQQIALLKERRQVVIHEAVTKGIQPNVEMKHSGIDWIGEIPSHWEVKRLKNVGNAIIGLTYSPNDLCDSNEGTLILRSSNLQNNGIEYNDNVYVKTSIPNKLKLRIGDIVICSRNGSRDLIGKCGIVKEKDLGNSFGAFTTVFRSNINNFLFQILSSGIFKSYSGRFLTSTINQLTIGNLNSFEVPIPPISEQEAIVAYLDEQTGKIDQAIALKTQQIEQLKAYKQSLINEVVIGKVKVA